MGKIEKMEVFSMAVPIPSAILSDKHDTMKTHLVVISFMNLCDAQSVIRMRVGIHSFLRVDKSTSDSFVLKIWIELETLL